MLRSRLFGESEGRRSSPHCDYNTECRTIQHLGGLVNVAESALPMFRKVRLYVSTLKQSRPGEASPVCSSVILLLSSPSAGIAFRCGDFPWYFVYPWLLEFVNPWHLLFSHEGRLPTVTTVLVGTLDRGKVAPDQVHLYMINKQFDQLTFALASNRTIEHAEQGGCERLSRIKGRTGGGCDCRHVAAVLYRIERDGYERVNKVQ